MRLEPLEGEEERASPSLSPLVSWDDSTLIDRSQLTPTSCVDDSASIHEHHITSTSGVDDSASIARQPFSRTSTLNDLLAAQWDVRPDKALYGAAIAGREDRLQTYQVQTNPVKTDHVQTDQGHMGITIRRTENINVFDDSHSDAYSSSGPPSPTDSGPAVDFVENRLLHPDEYFQELDDLGSKIFQKSMFHFYMDGTVGTAFHGELSFKAPFIENAMFQTCSYDAILGFCGDVTGMANEDTVDGGISGAGGHYTNHGIHHQAIENLLHLIECRNIISAAWESLGQMRSAHYCGEFISLLVLDRTRAGVARLTRIECSRIEQLAVAFETCLFQVMSQDPAMVLFNNITLLANDLTTGCQDLLLELDIKIPGADGLKDIWRCAVHVLDTAVLSYAGAHTQFLGNHEVASVSLPGPFLERQYCRFRRRSFSCLGEFLGGQEVWVLEMILPGSFPPYPPHLSLLTDAETFGDIWGPMWKSCVLGDEERIVQYNVGNGVILPWSPPSSALGIPLQVRKGEVFCHWMSDTDHRHHKSIANSSTLHANDTLLIGATVRLGANVNCGSSITQQKQSLRNSGALSEPGTIRNRRILSSEVVQMQVGGPYASVGLHREYKRRGRTMKQCLIEDWKHRPLNRKVRYLEFKLGLEVSTCTHNARRIRLIKLFGTQTMLNHLWNGALLWKSTDCREKFYSALQSPDHTAFRKLYESSEPDWQTDLGNAIQYCLDSLEDTGKSEKDLDLFWAPDGEPGLKATLRSSELSWISFLAETETSGTMAILEDRCLEVRSLIIGKKCQNAHFDPRHINNRLSISGGRFHASILQTAVQLNELCIPKSLHNGRIESVRRDGLTPRHEYRWSLSSLKEGDSFGFGTKGFLEAITPLNQGQILARLSRIPDILQSMKSTVLGGGQPPKMHYECIRDQNENTSPVQFFIMSIATNKQASVRPARRASFHANSTPVASTAREYYWDSSVNGYPRTGTSRSNISQETTDKLREALYRWRIRN